ncbi:MAG: RNA polymerase sigma factor [bacterium]|nr:RNA polymerase sigma factor [bacterium]
MKHSQAQIDRLVRETQQGNTKAFGEIYDLYFPQIYRYVFYKISEEHVDDLVGTVFIKAWTQIKKYRKGSCPFSSWLFRIASNSVIDHYRTNKEYYELEERIADENEKMSPEKILNSTLDGERVHRALGQIGKTYQEVILLKFLNEMSNKEVAKAMKTNESNVRTLQFRALKKLRVILEEQERKAQQTLDNKVTKNQPGLLKRIFARSS